MKNSTLIVFMAFVVSALLLIGCSKAEQTTNRSETAAPPPAAAPTTSTATASAGDIGIPECDAFLKAYEACVHDKVPAASRATFETGIATWKKTWKAQASDPRTKAALVAACKSSQEGAKTSMKVYGCTF
jgi:hypothetical protein